MLYFNKYVGYRNKVLNETLGPKYGFGTSKRDNNNHSGLLPGRKNN